MNNIVFCDSITKKYVDGKHEVSVFERLSLSVKVGEFVAIIGASGAGKSTLLQIMGGLDSPTNGCVMIDGQVLSDMSERARCKLRNKTLGFIYQFHHLLPEFTALENVCMPLLIAGRSKKQAIDRSREIIEQVGLSKREQHRIGELSGGERQRIAIARALVNNPKCILADEPTGNLDQANAEKVFELMLSLNASLGTSFVVVTHNNLLANRLGRVLCLENKAINERVKI